MTKVVRDGTGLLLVVLAIAGLYWGVTELREHDYLAAVLALIASLAVLRAGVELLRPTVGE